MKQDAKEKIFEKSHYKDYLSKTQNQVIKNT